MNPKPLFQLVQVVITPGALKVLGQKHIAPLSFLARHIQGDWSEMGAKDREINRRAVPNGGRIFSRYTVDRVRVWVITKAISEGVRASTCILLLPEKY